MNRWRSNSIKLYVSISATYPLGQKLEEHGIRFERLTNGDARYVINIMVDAEKYLEKQKFEGAKNLSQKDYPLKLHLIPFFNETPLDKVTSFDIERFKKHRHDKNAKPGTPHIIFY